MWILISFLVIALIVLSGSIIINMNTAFSPSIKLAETPEQKKAEEDDRVTIVDSMNDQAFRQALKSFLSTEMNEKDNQSKGKMKDDDYRKALQKISRQTSKDS